MLTGILAFSCTQKKPDKALAAAGDGMDRTVLPIREPVRPLYKELDVRNAKAPARFQVKAPKGAPNVVVILIDDMGFGVSEAFGGPVTTPTWTSLLITG